MVPFVLDTSAVLTVLNREAGMDTVLQCLDEVKDNNGTMYMPFMVLMELEYLLARKISPEETLTILTMVKGWPVEVVESTEEWRRQAAMIKSQTPLSVADAWIASLAMVYKAKLIHKDPEYEQVSGLAMVKLPYMV